MTRQGQHVHHLIQSLDDWLQMIQHKFVNLFLFRYCLLDVCQCVLQRVDLTIQLAYLCPQLHVFATQLISLLFHASHSCSVRSICLYCMCQQKVDSNVPKSLFCWRRASNLRLRLAISIYFCRLSVKVVKLGQSKVLTRTKLRESQQNWENHSKLSSSRRYSPMSAW